MMAQPTLSKDDNSSNRYLKWTLVVLGSLALLYLITQLVLNVFMQSYLSTKLNDKLQQGAPENYIITFDELTINPFLQSLEFNQAAIYPDSSSLDSSRWNRTALRGSISTQTISIDGIGLWNLLFNEDITVSTLQITAPDIHLHQLREPADTSQTTTNQLLFNALKNSVNSLEVERIVLSDTDFSMKKNDDDHDLLHFSESDFTFSDITVDSSSARRSTRFPTNQFEARLNNINYRLTGNMYNAEIASAGISSDTKEAYLDDFRLIPRYQKYEFAEKVGHQIDRLDLTIDQITLNDLQTDSLLLETPSFYAGSMQMERANLVIFHDKQLERPSDREPRLPHLALQELSTPISLDSITVRGSDIAYSEHQEAADQPGTIRFEQLEAALLNLQNVDDQPIRMNIRTKFMGESTFEAEFTFPTDPQKHHTIEGRLDPLDTSLLNPPLRNLAFVELESGQINSLNFEMDLDPTESAGNLTLDYEDLKVDLLDKNDLEQSREISSFLANNLKIKSDNTGEDLRQSEISFERDTSRSVFHYWWKSLLSGLEDNVGL